MSARFSQPRKLNIVSFLLLAAVIAGLYSAWQFGPAYYRKWLVKGVLSEMANKVYSKRMLSGLAGSELLEQLRKETVEKLRQEGIEDPGIQVIFDMQPKQVTVTASYQVVVKHPLVNKQTVLIFRPSSTAVAGLNE